MIGTDFWLYEGEPTDEEIQARKQWNKDNHDHLAINPVCPTCGSKDTMWVRQQWSICFNCESSFVNHYEDLRSVEDDFWRQFDG